MTIRSTAIILVWAAGLSLWSYAAGQSAPAPPAAMSVAEGRDLLWEAFWVWSKDADVDKAIALYQRVLDAFPHGFRATWPENLRALYAAGDAEGIARARQRWGGLYTLDATGGLAECYLKGKQDPVKASEYAERALREDPKADRMASFLARARGMVARAGELPSAAVFTNGAYFCGPVERSSDGATTLTSVRNACEDLGAAVTWDEATQSATATLGDRSITFTLGRAVASVKCSVVSGQWSEGSPTTNNQQLITDEVALRVAPYLNEDGRMMVPLRPLVEALGGTVRWEPEAQIVYVNLPAAGSGQPPEGETEATEEQAG